MSDPTLAREVIHAVAKLSDDAPVPCEDTTAAESEKTEETFLDSILENLPYMVFVKDALDLRFVRFNRAGEELLGYSREEMIGLNDYDLFPRDEADAFTKKDREVLANGGLAEISEEPVHTRHRGTRTLRTKKIPILGKDGTPKYLLGISEDVTQQRRKEREVIDLNGNLERRTSELQNAITELESLSYSVSHDLRSPLRALDGFGHFLLENHAEVLDESARDALDRIRSATQTMGGIIDGVLSLTRLARAKVHNAEVDLTATAERITAELSDSDAQRKVRFVIRKRLKHRGDPRLLRELLEHLLENAWKFTGRKSDALIEFDRVDGNKSPTYFIRDNGAGFDPRFTTKLFNAFESVHDDPDLAGRGLGLAMAERIVRRHGGRLWARGALGEGATFFFTLGPDQD